MRNIATAYLLTLLLLFGSNSFAESFRNECQNSYFSSPQVEIIAYPNPFNEGVNLEIISTVTKPTELRIFDIIGTERERIELTQFGMINVFRIELKNLPAGIYFCNVYADKKLLESKKITCTR